MPTAVSPIYLEERRPAVAVMDEALQIYIQDHLAGVAFALQILASLETQEDVPGIHVFVHRIREDIEHDRDILVQLATGLGLRRSTIKEWLAGVAERLARPKFHHKVKGLLGIFESLETLSLGILGKHALWSALETLPQFSSRADFARLKERAIEQHEAIDAQRMMIGRKLFARCG